MSPRNKSITIIQHNLLLEWGVGAVHYIIIGSFSASLKSYLSLTLNDKVRVVKTNYKILLLGCGKVRRIVSNRLSILANQECLLNFLQGDNVALSLISLSVGCFRVDIGIRGLISYNAAFGTLGIYFEVHFMEASGFLGYGD